MKITKKIRMHRDAIKANPAGPTAKRIREQSVSALLGGIKSAAWKTYMENFHSNKPQLDRLLGDDAGFMNHPDGWGPIILAYIVGSGPCGGGTELGMADEMSFAMKEHLNKGVPEKFTPGEAPELTAELKLFEADATWEETLKSDETDSERFSDESESAPEDEAY